MPKMIQVRNVSDTLHRELVRRARRRGLTLTRYIEEILEREVAQPPLEPILDRIAARPRVDLGITAAELIREEREQRGDHA